MGVGYTSYYNVNEIQACVTQYAALEGQKINSNGFPPQIFLWKREKKKLHKWHLLCLFVAQTHTATRKGIVQKENTVGWRKDTKWNRSVKVLIKTPCTGRRKTGISFLCKLANALDKRLAFRKLNQPSSHQVSPKTDVCSSNVGLGQPTTIAFPKLALRTVVQQWHHHIAAYTKISSWKGTNFARLHELELCNVQSLTNKYVLATWTKKMTERERKGFVTVAYGVLAKTNQHLFYCSD